MADLAQYHQQAQTLFQPARFIVGLDVGQLTDPTALAIAEREMILYHGRLEPRFLIRRLERVPLGTPYPQMVRDVRAILDSLHAPYAFVIDATGVGRPIVDLFRELPAAMAMVRYAPGQVPMPPASYFPIALTLTHGEVATKVPDRIDEWHVPKRDVILQLQVATQQERIRVARSLPDAALFVKEVQNFRWKVTKDGNDTYGAWRDGEHDDLLLAVAVACWWGSLYAPRQASESRQTHAVGTGNPMRTPSAVSGMRGRR